MNIKAIFESIILVFLIFFTNLCQIIVQMEINNPCIILDNCPIHKNEEIDWISNNYDCEYRFLPPYSPMLNPIEEVIKDVKHDIKSQFADPLRSKILNIKSPQKGSRSFERFRILKIALQKAIESQGKNAIKSHFNSMMAKLPSALGKLDLKLKSLISVKI